MSDELEAAAAAGDGEAMYALAVRLEAQARALDAQAREWLQRASHAGSLDARHGRVRIAVAEGDYDLATALLLQIEARFPDAPRHSWVSVAPDVLGRDLPLDSDGASDLPGAGVFTVITPYGARALETLRPVAPRLLSVDELGRIQPDVAPDGVEPLFTASYVDDLHWNYQAVQILLDTDGEMTGPMGRTMVAILVEALAAAEIPAHVAGDCPDLRPQLFRDAAPGAG
jgi:hypothetical protein